MKQFRGLYTAIITPFAAGNVDIGSLEKIIEEQIRANVDGIVVLGSTGESATLSPEEHRGTVRAVVEMVNGRVAVIAGAGSNSTATAVKLSKEAEVDGANALLIITPYCNKPSQKGLLAHYTAIAGAVQIPIVMYNVPSRTGVYMQPETVIELSKNPRIRAVKDAHLDFNDVRQIVTSTGNDFSVLSGNDGDTLEVMKSGGDGVIAVCSNVIPHQMREFIDVCLAMEWDRANELQSKYARLFKDLFIETNPLPVKTLMAQRGLCIEEFRLPLTPMYDGTKEQLLQTWLQLETGS